MQFSGEHHKLAFLVQYLTFNLFQNYLLFQEESILQYLASVSWVLPQLSSAPKEQQTVTIRSNKSYLVSFNPKDSWGTDQARNNSDAIPF